jgi:glycosyltransferase involved in cell wall biosynthesis
MSSLVVSAFYGGSHRSWADDVLKHVLHDRPCRLLSLSAEQWKWRMMGGAVTLARQLMADDGARDQIELIVCDAMIDLATFLALTRARTARARVLLYMHENQLTFPLHADASKGAFRHQDGERDRHFAFTNFTSMLAADCVAFNSAFHRDQLFAALPAFLNHYRDHKELESIAIARAKSCVLYVGVDLNRRLAPPPSLERSEVPLIIWNMRWDYDKCPDVFLRVLLAVARQGVAFKLAICGARQTFTDNALDDTLAQLQDRIVHHGLADADLYASLLWRADVTISTAVHEFFGIAVVEAMACEVFPLLPRRLSYPELVPSEHHASVMYYDEAHLAHRLTWALTHAAERRAIAEALAASVRARFDWQTMHVQYRERIQSLLLA